jgi:hypothetical protein
MVKIKNMKILMILSSPDKTGLTTHTLDLSAALVQLGHEVSLLTTVDMPKTAEQEFFIRSFIQKGIYVIQLNNKKGRIGQFLMVFSFLRELIQRKYDVIHVQSPYYTFLPWLLHKRFVSTLHVNDLVRCFYYKNATHLIAISEETKRYAKKYLLIMIKM